MTKIRTGQAPASLTRAQFQERFHVRFYDPAFDAERDAIARLEAIAWDALRQGRKASLTRPAGRGFADPTYEVSVQWLDTRKRLKDQDVQEEVRNIARSVVQVVKALRAGALSEPDKQIKWPRTK